MSNSSLVSYTKISPHKTKRTYRSASSNGKISKITIHHMAGCISVESCGSWFSQAEAKCSSNYGIDSTGKIALYVPEDYRSWCSSNADNDNIAITIEIANSASGDPWPVSDKAIAACIDLCVDICQRNGISQLNYTGTTAGNLTRHDMFISKVCPGPYLGAKFPYIVEQVNSRLGKPLEITESTVKPTIKKGDNNAYVSKCQELLIGLGYNLNVSAPTGDFDDNTFAAVKKFQTNNNLEVDGIVGPITWAALFSSNAVKNVENTNTTTTEEEKMAVCTAAQAVSAMEYWVGYYEKASSSYATTRAKSSFTANKGSNNYTYAGYLCGVQGQAWCAAQVSTAIYEACGNSSASAKQAMYGVWPYVNCAQVWDAAPSDKKFWSYYQRWTLGKGDRTTYVPIAGDIIVFTDNTVTRSHTGMVYAVDSTYVYTIEGNSGNMCRKRSYKLTDRYIYGWIRPNYKASSDSTPTSGDKYGAAMTVGMHILSKGCAGEEVRTAQILLNYENKKLEGKLFEGELETDGIFGTATETAVKAYQDHEWPEDAPCNGVIGTGTMDRLLKRGE